MKEYVQLIRVYEKKLLNLTVRVEVMEKDSISYTELDFELIKLEVKEMHRLVIQLKENFVGSTDIIDMLEVEVRNDWSQYIKNASWGWKMWHMPLIPALVGQRKADICAFRASLAYKESSRTVRIIQRNSFSKQTNKPKQNKAKAFHSVI